MDADDSISVVIPAYRAERFLAAAIESALAQMPRPLEVIVVDDGSDDATADVARSFGASVRLVAQVHGGEARARNAGLRAARGAWIAFLDADDRFVGARLAAVSAHLAHHRDLVLVTTDAYIVADGAVVGRAYGPNWRFADTDQRREILRRNFIFGHVVVRRERLLALGGFDETISHCTDWEMWIRLLHDGGRAGFVDRPLSWYRAHPNSLSADRVAMAEGRVATLRAAGRLDLTPDDRRLLDERLAAEELDLAVERLTTSLLAGGPSARLDAIALARHPGTPMRSRAKGVVAAVSPMLASAVVRRRFGGMTRGTMGLVTAGSDDAPGADGAAGSAEPLVSIVLPFLNEERFLQGAIDTVVDQTFTDWELFLVDDGSTDGSSRIADLAAERDTRIRVLRHPGGANRGLPASRNLGLVEVSSSLVASLDADDRWMTDKLERQVTALASHPGAAFSCGPTCWTYDDGRPDVVVPVLADAPRLVARRAFARLLVTENLGPPPPSNVLYRTDRLRSVGGVPAGDPYYEDQRTFVVLSLTAPVHVTDEVWSTYAVRSDSLYGSTAEDWFARRTRRRRFVRWALARVLRSGPAGVLVAARIMVSLGARRITGAVGPVVSAFRRVGRGARRTVKSRHLRSSSRARRRTRRRRGPWGGVSACGEPSRAVRPTDRRS